MNKTILLAFALLTGTAASAQFKLDKATLNNAADKAKKAAKGEKPLTNDEVVKGLKEALSVGTNNSTAAASAADGFYKNPSLKIPFPPDAQKVKTTLENLGMQKQVQSFEE